MQMKKPNQDVLAWLYIILLVLAVGFGMLAATPSPNDDYFYYQKFIEILASGRLDLSIPGFHGMNMVAVPWYLVTRSPLTQIHVQMLSGVFIPLLAFLAGRRMFRSTWDGVVFATIMAMMPFLSFSSLRGWMVATYHCLVLITLFGAARNARWTGIPLGLSIISLPFAVAIIPLLVALTPSSKKPLWRRYPQILIGISIAGAYVLLQVWQTGHVNVGVHQEFSVVSVWQGPKGMLLNMGHALQMLFSIHNFYFPNPAKTALGNLMHTTPILIFLGLFGLLSPKQYFREHTLPIALFLGALIGIGLNVGLDHMDHFYMETGILFLILAALPVLRFHPFWLPLVIATLHFQWLYFYLQFKENFTLTPAFFAVPILVDVAFAVFCLVSLPKIRSIFLNTFSQHRCPDCQRTASKKH